MPEDEQSLISALVPERMRAHAVSEADLAAAYARTSALERAWIKTAVASGMAWMGWARDSKQCVSTTWGQGLIRRLERRPRRWAVVHVPWSCADPALVVAGVLPIILAGVHPILVVLETPDTCPPALLTGLELAGVEWVYVLPPGAGEEFITSGRQEAIGPGMVVRLGWEQAGVDGEASGGRHLGVHLPRPRRMGVWLEEEEPDLQALAFAHPGLEITLWSAAAEYSFPDNWAQRHGTWTEFLAQDADAVWVPEQRMEQALQVFSLVLGPGQEPVWGWPWYRPELAWQTRVGLSRNTDEGLDWVAGGEEES